MRWLWNSISKRVAPKVKIRRLSKEDYPAARRFMQQAPYETVLMREALHIPTSRCSMQYFLGCFASTSDTNKTHKRQNAAGGERGAGSQKIPVSSQELTALCWVGANIIPWGFDEAGLDALAYRLKHSRLIANSFVGDAQQVLGLWERMCSSFRRPRDIHSSQLSMVYQGAGSASVRPDLRVCLAEPSDASLIFPASVAMFTEEVGYDPSGHDNYYAQRVDNFLQQRRTYARFGVDFSARKRVEFKADVGVLADDIAQIQGVWVPPDMRGQGIAAPAIAAVAEDVRQRMGVAVHLYVNDFNLPAVRSYEKAGFAAVGKYATIIL